LRPSERAFCDLLFTSKSGTRPSVKFSEMGKAVATPSRWKLFTSAIKGELRQRGLIDKERERTRGRVSAAGLAIAGIGFAGLIAAVPFVREYGGATLSIGIALLAVGITGLIIGQSLTPLTDDAVRRAGLWRAYGRHLEQLSEHTAPASVTPAAFTRMLPFAVAFRAALPWAKALEKGGVTAGPAWLRVLPHEEGRSGHMATTVAMLSAGHSAGSSAGHGAAGVSAGGAAGGGTSGAG
jgi:hypothetical protein